MKQLRIVFISFSLAALLMACGEQIEEPTPATAPEVSATTVESSGTTDDKTETTSTEGTDPTESSVASGNDLTGDDVPIDQYIGLEIDDVVAALTANGIEHRIVRIDDEQFAVTMDYVESRLNFEVDEGVVSSVSRG